MKPENRQAKPRPLTCAQKVKIALTLARIEGAEIRRWNAALATNKEKRILNEALQENEARFVTLNQSRGRGAHYRFPDGSALGAEVIHA
jgi:hypothetical protein